MKRLRGWAKVMLAAGLFSLMSVSETEAALRVFDTVAEREASYDAAVDWELARREAEQLAVEKAGMVFSSYTKTSNSTVEEDQLTVVLGTVAESSITNKEILQRADGKTVYRVKVHTVVDTDHIDKMLHQYKVQLEDMVRQYKALDKSYQAAREEYASLKEQNAHQRQEALIRQLKLNSLLQSAYKLVYNGRRQEAQKYIDKVLAIDPQNAEAYCLRGDIHRTASRDGEKMAFADYNRAVEYNPEHERARRGRGEIYKNRQKFAAAQRDFDKVLQLNPLDQFAYSERESVQFIMANPENGIWSYAEYVINAPIELQIEEDTHMLAGDSAHSAYIHWRRGQNYSKIGELKKAYEDFSKAIELDPSYVAAYYFRAGLGLRDLQWGMRNAAEISQDLDKVVSLAPEFAPAYEQRGNYFELMSLQASLYEGKGGVKPGDDDALLELAKQDYVKAVQLDPYNPRLLGKVADFLEGWHDENGLVQSLRKRKQALAGNVSD